MRHLMRFAIELRQFDFRGSCRVSYRYIELEVKFVLMKVMNVPTRANPAGTFGISGDPEPIVVIGLVHGCISYQSFVLLLQPLRPFTSVARAGFNG